MDATKPTEKIQRAVAGCARCGGDHESVTFAPLARAADAFSHWATCPETGEPILMTFDRGEFMVRRRGEMLRQSERADA